MDTFVVCIVMIRSAALYTSICLKLLANSSEWVIVLLSKKEEVNAFLRFI